MKLDVVDGDKEEAEEHPKTEAGEEEEGKTAAPGREEKPVEGPNAEVEEEGETGKDEAANPGDEAKEEGKTTEPIAGGLVGDVGETDVDGEGGAKAKEAKPDGEAVEEEEGKTGKDEAGNADDDAKKEEEKPIVDETPAREDQLPEDGPVDDVDVVPQPTGMERGRYMTQLSTCTASR